MNIPPTFACIFLYFYDASLHLFTCNSCILMQCPSILRPFNACFAYSYVAYLPSSGYRTILHWLTNDLRNSKPVKYRSNPTLFQLAVATTWHPHNLRLARLRQPGGKRVSLLVDLIGGLDHVHAQSSLVPLLRKVLCTLYP